MKCVKLACIITIVAMALVLSMVEAGYYGGDHNPTPITTTTTTTTTTSSPSPSPNPMTTTTTTTSPSPSPNSITTIEGDQNPTPMTTTITTSSPSPSPMPTSIAPTPTPTITPPKLKKPPPKGYKPPPRGPPCDGRPRRYGTKSGKGTYLYWQANPSQIPEVFMSNMATIDKIFGIGSMPIYGYKLTVMDALANNESNINNAYANLAQQAVTSLLNAYTVENYVYTPEQVREHFNDALVSPDNATKQALEFEQVNLLV